MDFDLIVEDGEMVGYIYYNGICYVCVFFFNGSLLLEFLDGIE